MKRTILPLILKTGMGYIRAEIRGNQSDSCVGKVAVHREGRAAYSPCEQCPIGGVDVPLGSCPCRATRYRRRAWPHPFAQRRSFGCNLLNLTHTTRTGTFGRGGAACGFVFRAGLALGACGKESEPNCQPVRIVFPTLHHVARHLRS